MTYCPTSASPSYNVSSVTAEHQVYFVNRLILNAMLRASRGGRQIREITADVLGQRVSAGDGPIRARNC